MRSTRRVILAASACAISCVELTGVAALDASTEAAADASAPRDTPSRACLGTSRGAPGAIDESRSHWGRATPWSSGLFSRGAVIDPQGRALVFGFVQTPSAREDGFVMRLLSDGSLDATWADAGLARVNTSDGVGPRRDALFVGGFDATGRLLASGWTFGAEDAPVYRGLAARFTSDGRLDASFGQGGVVTVAPAQGGFGPYGSLLDGDDLLLVGTDVGNGLGTQGRAMRITSRGEPDASFGDAGFASPAGVRALRAAVRDGDGYLFAAVTSEPLGAALLRTRRDGTLDAGFGEGGVARHPRGQGVIATSLLRQPDGALVIYGAYSPLVRDFEGSPTLLRFDANGRPDLGYGDGGLVATREGQAVWLGGFTTMAAMTCDGSVLTLSLVARATPMLQRFTLDGARDTSFGHDGRVMIPTLAMGAVAFAVWPRNGEASALVISACPSPLVVGHHVVAL